MSRRIRGHDVIDYASEIRLPSFEQAPEPFSVGVAWPGGSFGDSRALVAKIEHFAHHYNWQGHHRLW
jgi:hypothetical protein